MHLNYLSLQGCKQVTGVGVQWLAEGCPALQTLNVKGTKVRCLHTDAP